MADTARRFHPGELLVQRRAGVTQDAARLEGMLTPRPLDARTIGFLAERNFAALTARDAAGRLWTVPLLGAPGFLRGRDGVLDIAGSPARAGPLASVPVGGPAALLVVDFATRRRFRINGTLGELADGRMRVLVGEAFGNCPAYISERDLHVDASSGSDAAQIHTAQIYTAQIHTAPLDAADGLGPSARALIERADTCFLGTAHPHGNADTSHKGGRPGFVRAQADGTLWWPDYSGNNMFNSLGNLVENPEADLLFLDFATGQALHLSGTALLEWSEPGGPGDDDGTGRRVRFRPERVVATTVPLRAGVPTASPNNPPLLRDG